MQLNAIYDHGRLEFPSPIRFAHERFAVRVDIPEREVVTTAPSEPLGVYAQALADRLDAVRRRPLPDTASLPALSDETDERIDAWAAREDR
jgi:hypothetical protein